MRDVLPAASDCFVRLGVDLIAHRWDAVVLTVLRAGPTRRVEMLSAIGGISDKSLHQSLVRLRERGLVEQGGDAGSYRLTAIGTSFASGPLLALARWAEVNHGSLNP